MKLTKEKLIQIYFLPLILFIFLKKLFKNTIYKFIFNIN